MPPKGGGDASAMDLDQLMENFTQPHGGRAAAKSPAKDRRLDVKDCLATDNQGVHGLPQYTVRSPPASKEKGWTVAGRDRATNRFIGKEFMQRAGQSPGPIYQPRSFTEIDRSPGKSFPKGRRMGGGRATPGPGPAAKYEIPSTLTGGDRTRAASPTVKFGTAERFKGKEFISSAHAAAAGPSPELPGPRGDSGGAVLRPTPGPGQYFENVGARPMSPTGAPGAGGYTFGPKDPERMSGRPRFNSKVFISRAHAAATGPSGASPGPGEHQNDSMTAASSQCKRAPQWSIGTVFDPQGRGRPGSSQGDGAADDPQRVCRAQFISAEHAAKDGPARDSHLLPGPGRYFEDAQGDGKEPPSRNSAARALDAVRSKGPSYSFGVHTDSSKLFLSSGLSADAKGRVSPGPCYLPDATSTSRQPPSFSFADDPHIPRRCACPRKCQPDEDGVLRDDNGDVCATLCCADRFDNNRYIGGGIGNACRDARDMPGPAAYDVSATDLPQGPAYSIARRERLLMKRICPAPERARFMSKELAKENYGCYSPGPKYALAGTIGQPSVSKNPYGVFGACDRDFGDLTPEAREKLGSTVKPYTTPGEARFISRDHAEANKGRYGPGPMYNPQHTVLREKPPPKDGTPVTAGKSPQRTPHEVSSRNRTAPAVSVGSPLYKRVKEDNRDMSPDHRLTQRSAPSFGFGTCARGGLGGVQGIGEGAKGKKGDANKHLGEQTPGPGSFTPNYLSVAAHTPGVSMGGLANGYSADPVEKRKKK